MKLYAHKLLANLSDPIGDPSLIPTYFLSKFAKQFVTVALSGDGGDELFAGYDPIKAILPAKIYRKFFNKKLHNIFLYITSKLPNSDRNMSLDFKIKRFLRGLSYSEKTEIPIWMSGLTPKEISFFFNSNITEEDLYDDAINLWNKHLDYDEIDHALQFFTSFYLTDDILVKSDRASMMVSLESRAVFLDNDIVDFCQRLPNQFKFKDGISKYILKKALINWLPKNIIERKKKGFGIPINLWLRSYQPPSFNIIGLDPNKAYNAQLLHNQRRGDFRFFLWDLHVLNAIQNKFKY